MEAGDNCPASDGQWSLSEKLVMPVALFWGKLPLADDSCEKLFWQ